MGVELSADGFGRIAQGLASWYASHANIRCMWAFPTAAERAATGVRVIVLVEPTLDGDETSPAWMGNAGRWTLELEDLLACTVQLERLRDSAPPDRDAGSEREGIRSVTLHWRDPTYDPQSDDQTARR